MKTIIALIIALASTSFAAPVIRWVGYQDNPPGTVRTITIGITNMDTNHSYTVCEWIPLTGIRIPVTSIFAGSPGEKQVTITVKPSDSAHFYQARSLP